MVARLAASRDLGVDGLADGLVEVLDLGLLLGRQGCGRHGWTPFPGRVFLNKSAIPLVYKNSTNFQDAHRRDTEAALFS